MTQVKEALPIISFEKAINKDCITEVVKGTVEHPAVPLSDSAPAASQLQLSHPEEVKSTNDIQAGVRDIPALISDRGMAHNSPVPSQVVEGSEVKSSSNLTTKNTVLAFLQRVEEATVCHPDKSAELYHALCGEFQLADRSAEKLRLLVKALNKLLQTPYTGTKSKPANHVRLYLIGVMVCLLVLLPATLFLFSGSSEVVDDILVPT
ncbi:hypothetical protein CLOM_g3226 [Closterium sp. NIES-68]|nr:hypothetical protein CLOM_g3226 [Closterium sp. NIES-68]GJP76373.1 hypothetical protein CLOP_g6828 [Closterium sp. NIES-67]